MTEQAAGENAVEYVNIDVEVGIIVQSLMFRHRHKQADLATILGGGGQAGVSRKLRGINAFSVTDLMRIARAYDVDPGELLPRLDSNQQPCDYQQRQVSDGQVERWGDRFDRNSAPNYEPTWWPPELRWRDWVRTGWAGRECTPELEALVDGWDVRPADSRVTRDAV